MSKHKEAKPKKERPVCKECGGVGYDAAEERSCPKCDGAGRK